MFPFARYTYAALALVSLVVTGVFGYMGIEKWSFLDALYMTMITFTTVGYNEVRPLSTEGRVFTTVLMIGGVGTMLYVLTAVVQTVVEEEFIRGFVRRRRMHAKLSKLRDHYIVCGYGRVGSAVVEALLNEPVPTVVIENDPVAAALVSEMKIPVVEGSATDDGALEMAGVGRARGLVAALGSDSDNVFVTLSARGLNPDLLIVARSSGPEANPNLLRAGADRVLSPYDIGGLRLAMLATRPLAVDFLDSVLRNSGEGSQRLTEVLVAQESPLISATIRESCAPHGIQVLAIRRGGEVIVNPSIDQPCLPGDSVVLVGDSRSLESLEGKAR